MYKRQALTQELLSSLVTEVVGSVKIDYQGETLDFSQPAEHMTMAESLVRFVGLSPAEVEDPGKLAELLREMNLTVEPDWGLGKLQMELFEARVEDRLMQPTFITHYPAEVSPLSRRNDDNPALADRFELFIAGREIANGFSELNDPEDQAERFMHQSQQKSRGDLEAMHFDQDYITALEYGLPPTAGEGLGIDRLVLLLANAPSIRDVLFFPLMRPRDD